MKNFHLRAQNRETFEKIEKVLQETVVHRKPLYIREGIWPFVVIGKSEKGGTVIRTGSAEQARVQKAPVYIATLTGPHIPDSEGVPIEELAGENVPEELEGLKVFNLSPLRPMSITARRNGPSLPEAIGEALNFYAGNEDTAIIETPDESYWVLSVLKYLDEIDRLSPDSVLSNFYSRLGHYQNRFGNATSLYKH